METQTQSRLEIFFDTLRGSGFECLCNWEQKLNKGKIAHYTIRKDGNQLQVMFQEYSVKDGFTHYIESSKNNFAQCIDEFLLLLNKNSNAQKSSMNGEWIMIEPEKAKEYVILNDGEENIYIGKNKDKARKMCKAMNMYDELIKQLRNAKQRIVFLEGFTEGKADPTDLNKINKLLKQADQK